ncbi:MAG: DNA repair protein [Oscillospiraceae bacterium]|nr:DNA repair protein [Oscillospiraceae bacterium]
MTDKELRKLRRGELLEMLLEQTKENETLKNRIADLEARIDTREIIIKESGSIAEAALKLNGVFEAAQKAAEQYLENIRSKGGA